MKAILCAVAAAMAWLGDAQDQFPDFDHYQKPDYSKLLSSTLMQSWTPSFSGDERAYLASAAAVGSRNVLALVGTIEPREGGWEVAVGQEGMDNLQVAKEHLRTLSTMVASFEKELASMGHDGEVMKANLKHASIMIPKLIAADSARMFPDIPENHKWYEMWTLLKRCGLIRRSGRQLYGPNPDSRLMLALATQDACLNLPTLIREFKSKGVPKGATSAGTGILPALSGLRELIQKFKPELEILGHSPAKLIRDLDAQRASFAEMIRKVDGEFADVPLRHWASAELSALRKLGLIVGYPNP